MSRTKYFGYWSTATKMPFKFKEDVAIADVAFEATGKTLNELFESCADAVVSTMVKNRKQVSAKQKKIFTAFSKNIENLLHDFMNELIFLKDADKLLFGKCKVKIEEKGGNYDLKAVCSGEKINPKKHTLLVDVKAVTWHMYKVEKTEKGWKAFVILDV